jgi:hypothetical protein
LKHEVEHIVAGDLEAPSGAPVGLLEGVRHND